MTRSCLSYFCICYIHPLLFSNFHCLQRILSWFTVALIVKLETTGLWSPPHCSFQHCISQLKGCSWKAHLPFEPPLDWGLGFQHLWQLLLPNSFLRSLRAESVPVSSLQLPTDLAQTSIQLQLSEWNEWMFWRTEEYMNEYVSTFYKKEAFHLQGW